MYRLRSASTPGFFVAAFAILLLAACAGAPPRTTAPQASAPAATVAPSADDNLNAVAWAQTAVEHDLVYREVYRDAIDKLPAALTDPHWDALPRDERRGPIAGLKPAVILDVDETVLDNSPYQARLVRSGAEYDPVSWDAWCREQNARPLPGALAFTRYAAAHGVTVFYLSNRAQHLNAVTLANLRTEGFPIATDADVLLGLGTVVPGCAQQGSEKGCRRELIGRGYRVLMQFGDQLGDFLDVLPNTREHREQVVAPYLDWIGERWFVLPNPTYGSWEPALFGDDWTKPRRERRRDKIQALSVD